MLFIEFSFSAQELDDALGLPGLCSSKAEMCLVKGSQPGIYLITCESRYSFSIINAL